MRNISWEEYEKKRKLSKLDFLQIKDKTTKKVNGNLRTRDKEKRLLLYKIAKKKQKKLFEKIGKRKYKLID